MRNGSGDRWAGARADARLGSTTSEVSMLLLLAATLIAILSVAAAWGSDIDSQARFRLELLHPVEAGRHPRNSAA
jgi:hypothetical protein